MRQAEDKEKPEDRRPWWVRVSTVEGRGAISVGYIFRPYVARCVPRGFKAADLCVVDAAQNIVDDKRDKDEHHMPIETVKTASSAARLTVFSNKAVRISKSSTSKR
jgi:hypothetical protein